MSTHVLVLARRDAYEAIRVAAGLTIRNNTVDFVFMTKPSINAQGKFDHFEMLELAEVTPQSLIDGVPDTIPCTDLAGLINKAQRVVSF
ncbi:hypothetical protein [Terasakiella pusilla]|uniref:hypothetical protein n=1 Tax=Terasakiella pusilla TaxID=64973 RepID=UPI003AA971B5